MIQEYLQKMKKIHQCLLEFIDNKDDIEEKYQNLTKLLDDNQIRGNKYDLELFIHLLNVMIFHQYLSSKISKISEFDIIFWISDLNCWIIWSFLLKKKIDASAMIHGYICN